MNLLHLNASPNRTRGNTHAFLAPFLAECTRLGASVKSHFVADLTINPCRGCFSCWKARADCVIDDDMRWLLPKIAAADVLILGAPLYVFHVPAPLKAIIDRTIPLASPLQEIVDGESRHLSRDDHKPDRAILLASVCGFWEKEHFDHLCDWTDTLCRASNVACAGKLLRPHAYVFSAMPSIAPAKRHVLKALKQAARELIETRRISPETESAVAAELIGREAYLRAANQSW